MTTGEKIRQLRIAAGMTQEDLGKAAKTTKQNIYKYETGIITNIPAVKIGLIAKALNTTPAYLMGWEQFTSVSEKPLLLCDYSKHHIMYRVPVLGTISAGLPVYAEENIEGYIYTDLGSDEDYFALRVKGDSMNKAYIKDGSILIIRKQSIVSNGDIAVVMVDGEDAVVKKFYLESDIVTLIPKSTNIEYLPQSYDLRETKVEILGKVVRIQIDL